MNDIHLIKTNNTFDWNFTETDIDKAIGDDRLRSAVIHAISLKRGELIQEIYKNKGSLLYNYSNTTNTETNRKFLEEAIKLSCTEIEGISDAKVNLVSDDLGMLNIADITIIKNDGEEVCINGT